MCLYYSILKKSTVAFCKLPEMRIVFILVATKRLVFRQCIQIEKTYYITLKYFNQHSIIYSNIYLVDASVD